MPALAHLWPFQPIGADMQGYTYKRPGKPGRFTVKRVNSWWRNDNYEPVWRARGDDVDQWQRLGEVIERLALEPRTLPVDTYMLQRIYPKR